MIRAIIAFLASILTAVQAFLLFRGEQAICFNEGCAVVDSMTAVSPLVINSAGALFFQVLGWLFILGRHGLPYWHKLARLLLLAGLGVEAVLVYFQYAIAAAFCSYCLIIFAVILLLNVCCGLRQTFRGGMIFVAVGMALFALNFKGGASRELRLDAGSAAILSTGSTDVGRYLFFSASCPHCEQVIAALDRYRGCQVRFNPIERAAGVSLSAAQRTGDYDFEINRDFLRALSIKEVPVLVTVAASETHVYTGEKRILEYLAATCGASLSGKSGINLPLYRQSTVAPDGACRIDQDCE